MLKATTTFFTSTHRLVAEGSLVREADPVVKGRKHLFINIEDAVPELDKPKPTRRTAKKAAAPAPDSD